MDLIARVAQLLMLLLGPAVQPGLHSELAAPRVTRSMGQNRNPKDSIGFKLQSGHYMYRALFFVGGGARCKSLFLTLEAVSQHAPDLWLSKIFPYMVGTYTFVGFISQLAAHGGQ